MADLDISNNIFTENGSHGFKNKIAEKRETFLLILMLN